MVKKAEVVAVPEHKIREMLRTKYSYPAYAFFDELRDCTGFSSIRSADGVALSLWPGRGILLHGFEIKVSRADWLNELKDPSKSEIFIAECDHWWLVAPKEIIQRGEIPMKWGWLQVKGNHLYCAKMAPLLKPKPLSRSLLASLVYRTQKQGVTLTEKERETIRKRGFEQGKEFGSQMGKYDIQGYKSLREAVDRFERASGIQINNWSSSKIGYIVDHIVRLTPDKVCPDLEFTTKRLKQLLGELEQFGRAWTMFQEITEKEKAGK